MTTGNAWPGAAAARTWGSRRRLAGLAQASLVLGLPFLRVGGESALRLDVPSLRLHVAGASLAMDELFPVLAASLLVAFAFLLGTLVLGRAWCGWACPQTVLGDLTAPLLRWRARGGARAAAAWLGLLLVAALVSANLLWYFVEPRAFLAAIASGTLHPVAAGSWAVLSATVLLDLAFLRARFCATACPYARMQGVLLDAHSLVVAYDRARAADCVECRACVRVCPTGIDIRDGLQMECIACAECIDACEPIMARLGRPPGLVGYVFGARGRPAGLTRPAVLATGALTAAALALLAGATLARSTLDLEAQAAADFAPRRSVAGQVMNAYAVSLENRGRAPLTLALSMSLPAGDAGGADAAGPVARLRPDLVTLAAGEHRRLRVLALVDGLGPSAARVPVDLVAASAEGPGPRQTRRLSLAVPEERAP